MKEEGTRCRCIRCMEIGDEDKLMESPNLVVRSYIASGDKEYYISIESNQKSIFMLCHYYYYKVINFCSLLFTAKKIWWNGHINTYNGLIGFCRLRIDSKPGGDYIKELKDCALIREVHVYGHCLSVGSTGLSSQHRGFGQLLVKTAEHIAIQNGFSKIAVIAGVGTREYYKNKCGYELIGTYMIKNIEKELIKFQKNNTNKLFFWSFIIILLSIYYIIHHLF
jgi:elongator complex protein 3